MWYLTSESLALARKGSALLILLTTQSTENG
jgi:hypothetical protein